VVERVAVTGTLDRRIITTTKAVLRRRDVEQDLIEAGFRLSETGHPSTDDGFEWLIAEAAE
jgi:hypothetical protein